MKRTVSREYTLTEDEIREAMVLFLKLHDMPMPSGDDSLSIRSQGKDLTEIEIIWSTRDEI